MSKQKKLIANALYKDDSIELMRIADMLHDIMRNEPLNGLVTDEADRVFDDVRGHLASAINTIRLSNVVMRQH